MTAFEIAILALALIAAAASVAALVIALIRNKKSKIAGGGSDAEALYAASMNTVKELTREIDYAKRAVLDANTQSNQSVAGIFNNYLSNVSQKTDSLVAYMEKSMQYIQTVQNENATKINGELQKQLAEMKAEFKAGVVDMRADMQMQVKGIRDELAGSTDKMRAEMQARLKEVRDDNEKQLGQMRATVEEKLSETLEKRVQDAFKQVSDRLDNVQKGFGEMKELTTRVGNLNKIFANVKTRGTWGEVSLQSLLEQILAPEQYRTQCSVSPRSREKVDFAVIMPGQAGEEVLLPIDAKFPLEDYNRLLEAGEDGDKAAVDFARKALFDRVKSEARSIADKYIKVPYTTNFAVMYVPNEGLYAELLRDGMFIGDLQTNFRVTVCGPTTVSALLNSLQVGFTTLKIQKKSGEIIKLMRDVRKDFEKFTDLIVKVKDRAQSVVRVVDDIDKRNQMLNKKLDKLGEDLPPAEREEPDMIAAASTVEETGDYL